MDPIAGDRVEYVKRENSDMIGIAGFCVHDLLNAGFKEFETITDLTLKTFDTSQEYKILSISFPHK